MPGNSGVSFVTLLNRLGQGLGRASRRPPLLEKLRVVDPPEFSTSKSGPDHEPSHLVTCRVQCAMREAAAGDGRWIDRVFAAQATGPTMSAAKELAARRTLQHIEQAAKEAALAADGPVIGNQGEEEEGGTGCCSASPRGSRSAPSAASAAAAAEDNSTSGGGGQASRSVDLSILKLPQLRKVAKLLKIPRYYSMTKADLVDAIEGHDR